MKRLVPFLISASLFFTGCSSFSNYDSETTYESSSSVLYDTETTTEFTSIESTPETSVETSATTELSYDTYVETTTPESVSKTVTVPDASYMCEGKHYSKVVEMFKNAGFTNVTAYPYEENYNKDTRFEGCVVMVFVDGNSYFDESAAYPPDTEVDISYVISPAKTEVSTTVTSSTTSAAIDDTNGVTVPLYSENEGDLVWVPTNGGTKYHSRAGCSNMKDPIQVTKDTAIANGYTPCGRCY